MEVLQYSLTRKDLNSLNSFQAMIWEMVSSLLNNINHNKISNRSSIEKGLGVDVFLLSNSSDFCLYLSINENHLYINSKYFDIYVYPEIQMEKIKLLIEQILSGNYYIHLSYGVKDKLIYKELIFDNSELGEFNENKKMTLFKKRIKSKQNIRGADFLLKTK